jgi:cholinesterase
LQGFSCPANTAISGGSTSGFNIAFANITAAGLAVLTALGQLGDKFSEDCLTLNVWVPSGGESKKAVLLWIYGGAFSTGTSHTPTYNGQYLASQEDVIVVSIKYAETFPS